MAAKSKPYLSVEKFHHAREIADTYSQMARHELGVRGKREEESVSRNDGWWLIQAN